MKTSSDFLDAVKNFYGLKSDYQLARFLKLTDSRVSFYRTGKSRFDEDTCILIAKSLNLDPGYVMACVAGERTKSQRAREEWERVARLLGGLAAGVLLALTLAVSFDYENGGRSQSALQGGGFQDVQRFDIIYRPHRPRAPQSGGAGLLLVLVGAAVLRFFFNYRNQFNSVIYRVAHCRADGGVYYDYARA